MQPFEALVADHARGKGAQTDGRCGFAVGGEALRWHARRKAGVESVEIRTGFGGCATAAGGAEVIGPHEPVEGGRALVLSLAAGGDGCGMGRVLMP